MLNLTGQVSKFGCPLRKQLGSNHVRVGPIKLLLSLNANECAIAAIELHVSGVYYVVLLAVAVLVLFFKIPLFLTYFAFSISFFHYCYCWAGQKQKLN